MMCTRPQTMNEFDTSNDDDDDDDSCLDNDIPLKELGEMLRNRNRNKKSHTTSNIGAKDNKEVKLSTNVDNMKPLQMKGKGRLFEDVNCKLYVDENDCNTSSKLPHAKTLKSWNVFWTTATKVQKKKRRKPLTVIESKKRRGVKARREYIKRLNDFTKPFVGKVIENPDLYL